ncbi:uncharacterized protein LOC117327378 [Pecten maximus]|uniref:uncharacterized protein LOC117327378 n=1 Tax=Pecten maximus TaxID=6579 RepID=UPI001458C715|nr:uncharacterized protein LOC117327378 [Pecten maximus]
MVLREQTVVQVSSLVKDLDRTMKLNDGLENIVQGNNRQYIRREKPQLTFGNNDRVKACIGNHLFHAVFKCRFKKVKLMLDRGFDVNMRNSYGYSVLVAALHIDDNDQREKMFRMLINRNADPLQKDPKHGRHVLCWACLLGRVNEVEFLLDTFKGDFDLHEKDKEGMTVLHHATQAGQEEVVTMLALEFRRFGLSVDVVDNLGLTPYLHARRLGYSSITRILQNQGRACPGQGDMFTFRNGREWSSLGREERHVQQTQERFGDYMKAAILGRSRVIHRYQNRAPLIKVIPPAEDDVVDGRIKFVVKEKTPIGGTKRVSFAPPPAEPRPTHLTLPSDVTPRPSMALTMIDMTPGSKQVDHFKSSHAETQNVDTGRSNSHGATIANMFGVLAQQNAPSFRPTVVIPTAEPEVVPSKQKRSTLAILFGKQNKKKVKSPRGSEKKKPTKEKKTSKGRK